METTGCFAPTSCMGEGSVRPRIVDLDALVAEWAPRLGLGTWTIKIRFCRRSDLSGGEYADVQYQKTHEWAVIRVLDPGDWSEPDFPQDIEHSVIHELLHLALAPVLPNNEYGDLPEEQFVNRMARALLELKRG